MKTIRYITGILFSALFAIGGIYLFSFESGAADFVSGDVITLGSYPQTQIEDEALINALNILAEDMEWLPMGYTADHVAETYFYKDVLLDGDMYRVVRFSSYNSAAQARNGYLTNTVYWFRFDPVEWTVLDPDSGLLIADSVLDVQPINHTVYDSYYADAEHQFYINNYAHASIRIWLNESFSETAFSDRETELLILREQDNDLADMDEIYTRYTCENTSDIVFLLSYFEAANENWFPDDNNRIRVGTSYARALGLENYSNQSADYPDNDFWFLRSPGGSATTQGYISPSGVLSANVDSQSFDVGICPALYIDLDAYEQLITAEEPTLSPYSDLIFDYTDGILTVSGTGAVPAVDLIEDTPLAPFAEDCKVIIISDGIESIEQNAFRNFDQLKMLILNGNTTLATDAFATNEAVETVVCAENVLFSENTFSEDAVIDVYEPKNAPHNGTLPSGCDVMPYSFSDGTLFVEGDIEMDMYALLDLMAVMCGYYDYIRFVRFDSYTAIDVPFYVYSQKEEGYVLAENNTLNGVSFSVKISGEDGWETITFNDFCALAGSHELGTFHLVAETESGEDVQESAFRIVLNNIQSSIKKVLKWIVGLLNYMFNILSKFKNV